jgi:putative ABC transport system permease protein
VNPLALRMLARDWRAGELRVLAAALVVAVASVTSVAFFADRVSRALVRDAHQLLGADLVLVSDRRWAPAVGAEILRRGLQRAEAVNFISMARGAAGSQLAGVKAVSDNYPLRGRLRIAPAPNAPDAPASAGPARGTVWLEERLVSALGTPVGAATGSATGESRRRGSESTAASPYRNRPGSERDSPRRLPAGPVSWPTHWERSVPPERLKPQNSSNLRGAGLYRV